MASGFASNSRRLEGKVAIITGGASGIGEATVRLFIEHGALVVIGDIQDDKGLNLAKELGEHVAAYVHCNVSIESDVKALVAFAVDKWGKLDIMFNNAGTLGKSLTKSVMDMDMDDFDHIISINTRGIALGLKHASKVMVASNTRGSIICTASISSITGGLAPVAYTVSKHGVVGLVRAASSDLGKYGIRVNCISPAAVVTPLAVNYLREVSADPSLSSQRVQELCDQTRALAGLSLLPLDIAHAAFFLASHDSAFVSGVNLLVDGGFTAAH